MKIIFAMATFLLSVSAFANCPSFAGSWTCQDTEGNVLNPTIAESSIPNGMQYVIQDEQGTMEILADGQTRDMNEGGMTGTINAKCSGNSVIVASKGRSNDGAFNFDANGSFTASNGQIKMFSKLTVIDQHRTQTQTVTATCNRR